MRDDLLDVQAAIDWADSQIPKLQQRFADWIQDKPYLIAEEPHPEMRKKLIKLAQVASLPAIFNAEVGAIINSIRSSLDLAATAVALRYSVPHADKAYFPVAVSRAAFEAGRYKGAELIKALPPSAAEVIKTIKPYPGGDDCLVALHALDNLRKHRRLLQVGVMPSLFIVDPAAYAAGLEFIRVWPGLKEGAVIATVPIDATETNFAISLQITFSEATAIPNRPVVSALGDFARHAESIVKLFNVL